MLKETSRTIVLPSYEIDKCLQSMILIINIDDNQSRKVCQSLGGWLLPAISQYHFWQLLLFRIFFQKGVIFPRKITPFLAKDSIGSKTGIFMAFWCIFITPFFKKFLIGSNINNFAKKGVKKHQQITPK